MGPFYDWLGVGRLHYFKLLAGLCVDRVGELFGRHDCPWWHAGLGRWSGASRFSIPNWDADEMLTACHRLWTTAKEHCGPLLVNGGGIAHSFGQILEQPPNWESRSELLLLAVREPSRPYSRASNPAAYSSRQGGSCMARWRRWSGNTRGPSQ